MSDWINFFATNAWRNLVVALAHTLWQAPLAAVCLAAALRSTPAKWSTIRYGVSLAALAMVVLAGLTTYATLTYPWQSNAAESEQAAATTHTGDAALAPPPVSPTADPIVSLSAWTPALALLWLAGVSFMTVRMFGTVLAVQRFRHEPILPAGELLDAIRALQERMRIRQPIRVVVSEALATPAVFGIWSPVLILPVSIVTSTPVHEVEAVVLHELAHIRRHDFVVDLLQMLVEALLFFNPAVWWISRQIRQEREACADAAAVAMTGRPLQFAQILADWAERIRHAQPAPSAVAAFAGRRRFLADRVRRLLVPDHLPELSVSPLAMTPLLLSGVLLFAGLYQGTTVAVALVAQSLSPRERVEQVTKVQGEFDNIPDVLEDRKLTIKATIRTHEGAPLPENTQAHVVSVRKRSSHSIALGKVSSTLVKEIPYGAVYLRVEADGYAPTIAGPFHPDPNAEELSVGELVLQAGFVGRLQVQTLDGKPIAKAQLKGNVPMRGGYPIREWTADDGSVVISNASSQPYTLSVVAEGYQPQEFKDVRLAAERPVVLALTPAKPTTGRLVDQAGRPVAGAEIRLYARSRSDRFTGDSRIDGEHGPVLAWTGADGRFRIDSLADDWTYCLMFSWDGRRFLHTDVVAGQTDLTVTAPKEVVVRGKVVGDLGNLPMRDGKPVVQYTQTVRLGNHSSRDVQQYSAVSPVEDQDDATGRFVIRDLLATELTVSAGSASVNLDLTKPLVDEVVLDLRDEPAQKQTRKVVLLFDPQENGVEPAGVVGVFAHGGKVVSPSNDQFIVTQGRLELEVEAPCTLHFGNQRIAGYWFELQPVDVPLGDGPLTHTIPLYPAGGIFGEVSNSAGDLSVGAVTIRGRIIDGDRPPHGFPSPLNVPVDGSGKFFLSPLPLGATVVVKASRGKYNQVSEPVTLTASQPTQRVDFTLDKGVECSGIVVDEQGAPIADAPVTLHFEHPHASTSYAPPVRTDEKGRFAFSDLNPKVGEYSAVVDVSAHFVPQQVKLQLDGEPVVIRMQRGQVIEGVVLDDVTGWPVPGVEVYALVKDHNSAIRRFNAETPTDRNGRFRFSNLPDAPVRLNASGLLLYQLGHDNEYAPGAKDVVLRGEITPSSKLRPAKPE